MGYNKKENIDDNFRLDIDDILAGNSKLNLFDYSQEDYDMFVNGFDTKAIRGMMEKVSDILNGNISLDDEELNDTKDVNRVEYLINYIQSLSSSDLDRFETMVNKFDTNPHVLWNMLNNADKALYKKPEIFYKWLASITDEKLDQYVYKAIGGSKLHPDDMYRNEPETKVEMLDGFIAISSSNLKALDMFRDRIIKTHNNNCSYEHRIKTHDGVKVHSYVFDMNNMSD